MLSSLWHVRTSVAEILVYQELIRRTSSDSQSLIRIGWGWGWKFEAFNHALVYLVTGPQTGAIWEPTQSCLIRTHMLQLLS